METKTTNRRGRGASSRYSRRPRPSGGKYRGKTKSSVRGRSGGGNRRGGGGGRKMPTFNPLQFINTNPVEVKEDVYVPKHGFGDFGLDERTVKTLTSIGMITPSPIQDQIIPEIMDGHDVIGLAETGTGKTAAFLLPIIQKTIKDFKRQTLIMAPTRELAIQIEEELKTLSPGFRFNSVICVGGINIRPQIRLLKRHNNFIIGTPGRLLDLLKRGNFDPKGITTVVLDEADRMLDMGFINDMKSILGAVPKERETLFFSATMGNDTKQLVNQFLKKPVTISVKKKDVTNSIEQDVVSYDDDSKFETLAKLFKDDELKKVIIFTAMKHSAEKLSKELIKAGIKAEAIHGNKNHMQRQRALKSFKDGQVKVLVATDVAARGIHVDKVSHVINYDLPNTFEDYVHRIGRTGRGAHRGKALTFVTKRSVKKVGIKY